MNGSDTINFIDDFEYLLDMWAELKTQLYARLDGSNDGDDQEQSTDNVKADASGNESDIQLYLATALQERIRQLQKERVDQIHPNKMGYFEDMLYAFVALIDEQLLQRTRWHPKVEENNAARRKWLRDFLLERALFGSSNAGTTLITRMQAIAATEGVPGTEQQQIISIYLHVLWLGFDGEYEEQPKLAEKLRKSLTEKIGNRIRNRDQPIFDPEAYRQQQFSSLPEERRLAPIARWNRGLVYAIVFWLLASASMHYIVTIDLREALATPVSDCGPGETDCNQDTQHTGGDGR